tara:strand:+ start:398 stop:1054 length:657 start_codon:yes stop_codon:yes gene_type:complete
MVEDKLDIAIIDYGINNLFSVKRACDIIGLKSLITSDSDIILSAKGAILPGVGAFPHAMKIIKSKKLDYTILKFVESKKPLLGICLGMHLLLESSTEFEETPGLAVIKGSTKKFKFYEDKKNICSVPQIGWNKIYSNDCSWEGTILSNNKNEDFMYFVHSYYVEVERNIALANTFYGQYDYCSTFQKDNIMATQFHPEKSGVKGLKIYKNLKDVISKN